MMQQDLFGNIPKKETVKASLVIAKKGKQQLSASQQAFNRLTQQIEKLQKSIIKKQEQLDLAMQLYGSDYLLVVSEKLGRLQQLIVVLWNVYQGKKLSKANQRHLKDVLIHHLMQYFELSETKPDDTLQDIFLQLEGISYDKMLKEEEAEEWAEMTDMFSEVGVDISGVDFEDRAAVAEKMAEAKAKLMERNAEEQAAAEKKAQQKAARKTKSNKQLEHEKMMAAAEEAKKKNISSIYRQLAKLFHPDLEQDELLKAEKEILMKELTAAFEAKDLHTLLTLELKWIHKEHDHLADLTEEKLDVYLQLLKQQLDELKDQKDMLIHQPQYAVLFNKFGYYIVQDPLKTIKKTMYEHLATAVRYGEDAELFASETGLRYVNEMIKEWKKLPTESDMEQEFLNMLLGGKL